MTRLFLSFVLLLLTIVSNSQTFITTQDINVRNGAGSKYKSLGVITSGSSVEVLDIKGKWSKITFEGNDGYVSTKFLRSYNSSSSATTGNSDSSSFSGFSSILKWIIGIAIFLGIIKIFGFKKIFSTILPDTAETFLGKYKCTKCGRTTFGRDTKSCPNGGPRMWYKI